VLPVFQGRADGTHPYSGLITNANGRTVPRFSRCTRHLRTIAKTRKPATSVAGFRLTAFRSVGRGLQRTGRLKFGGRMPPSF
jgi:hypothetical protein